MEKDYKKLSEQFRNVFAEVTQRFQYSSHSFLSIVKQMREIEKTAFQFIKAFDSSLIQSIVKQMREIEKKLQVIVEATKEARNIYFATCDGRLARSSIISQFHLEIAELEKKKSLSASRLSALKQSLKELEDNLKLDDASRDETKINSILQDLITTIVMLKKGLLETKKSTPAKIKKNELDLLSFRKVKANYLATKYSIKNQDLKFTQIQNDIITTFFDYLLAGKKYVEGSNLFVYFKNKSSFYNEVILKRRRSDGSPYFHNSEIKKVNEALLKLQKFNYTYLSLDQSGEPYFSHTYPIVFGFSKQIKGKAFLVQVNRGFFQDESNYRFVFNSKYLKAEIKKKCPYIKNIQDTDLTFLHLLCEQSIKDTKVISRKLPTLVRQLDIPSTTQNLQTGHSLRVEKYFRDRLFPMAKDIGFIFGYDIKTNNEGETLISLFVNRDKINQTLNRKQEAQPKALTYSKSIPTKKDDYEKRKQEALAYFQSLPVQKQKEIDIFADKTFIQSEYNNNPPISSIDFITPQIRKSLSWHFNWIDTVLDFKLNGF